MMTAGDNGGFSGERVLVTGAGRGLGLALARYFAGAGAQVIAACRDPERAAGELPRGCEVVKLDVGDANSITALAALLAGRALDILINNAAVRGDTGGLASLQAQDFLQVLSINAVGPLLLSRALLPNLMRGRRRLIANISSRAGSIAEGQEPEGDYAYRCSKAALNMASAKLAHDLCAQKLIVLALHPGWVKTDMGGEDAEVEASASAAGLARVMASATIADSGSFRSYDGSPIAW